MNYRQAKERAKVLKALSHPMRLLIVEALAKRALCVTEICSLGKLSQSNVSRHLYILKQHGIVSDQRIKNRVIYRLVALSVLEVFEPAANAVRTDMERRRARTRSV